MTSSTKEKPGRMNLRTESQGILRQCDITGRFLQGRQNLGFWKLSLKLSDGRCMQIRKQCTVPKTTARILWRMRSSIPVLIQSSNPGCSHGPNARLQDFQDSWQRTEASHHRSMEPLALNLALLQLIKTLKNTQTQKQKMKRGEEGERDLIFFE